MSVLITDIQPPQTFGEDSRENDKQRAEQISREILARASWSAERGLAIARMVAFGLLLLRECITYSASLAGGVLYEWLFVGLFSSEIVFCGLVLSSSRRLQKKNHRLRRLLILSTLVDTLVVALAILFVVLYPFEEVIYPGILSLPYLSALVLIIITAGLRLSHTVALLNGGVTILIFFVLLFIERAFSPLQVNQEIGLILHYLILLLVASLISFFIAYRTARLVIKSAAGAIEAERVRKRLGTYVDKEIAKLALTSDELFLGGNSQQCAVLFSDIRGFTAYAEKLSPEQLVLQLNDYLEAMVAVISAEGGVVDKYLGDGIMAVFGVPVQHADDASQAIHAAWNMQKALANLNERRTQCGLPPLVHGIGVHYGSVVAGHIGTVEHAPFTIVGEAVDVAGQLESATKELQIPVLLSEEVCQAARKQGAIFLVRSCGELDIANHSTPLAMYTFVESLSQVNQLVPDR